MKPTPFRRLVLGLGVLAATAAWTQGKPPAASAMARMPVREVTVFKDGHAFVTHQGHMPTDETGKVVMDYLPAPVLGTFWPYSAESRAKLVSVTAGQRRVAVSRSPLTIRELIEANEGAEVVVTETPAGPETPALSYPATILAVPERTSEELERSAPPNSGDLLPQKGDIVLLETEAGVKAVALARILDVTFREPPRNPVQAVEFRNLLTLRLDWAGRTPPETAEVGLTYLQRGIRWIPTYKLTIDGDGTAKVRLQATLLNEVADLEDVTCHLVVGVPSFRFKETVDPMAMQQALAQLSSHFQESDAASRGGQLAQARMFSNAIMTQVTPFQNQPAPQAVPGASLGQEGVASENVEDLYVFTVEHVTLRKGERVVVPVAEYSVPYEDIYVVDIPFAPPTEVCQRFSSRQRDEVSRMLDSPKATHKLRLTNKSSHPFTTAPALLLRGDRVLAQSLMTYTPRGGSVDVAVTASVDVQVRKAESEVGRTNDAVYWYGDRYARVELKGTVTLTNFGKRPVRVETLRHVLGHVTRATEGGQIDKLNALEDDSGGPNRPVVHPYWWGWWDWPYWWARVNGVDRVRWQTDLRPGSSVDLDYEWHYFWR